MGITPPDPLTAIRASRGLDYDDIHHAFAGPLYLRIDGSSPGEWILTAYASHTVSKSTYDILRAASDPDHENLFRSGTLKYGLFDGGSTADAEPA